MTVFTVVSDFLLYAVFAFIAGSIFLQFIPEAKKPVLRHSKKLVMLCVAGILVFSAAPVIELAAYLADFKGWPQSIITAIADYRTGQGWLLTVLASIIFIIALYFNASKYMQAFYILLLLLLVGFYSHVSTLDLWLGSLSHFVHFFFISLWAGILLHVAWFSKKGADWKAFLKWFTPFALLCMAAIIASGIVIMFFFVEPADYANSWVLPYGQTLLLKHLSIIPLLAAAFANGFMNRKQIFERSWLRMESFLLLLILILTAFMSKQAPPHNVNETLRMEGTAPFLKMMKGDQYIPVAASLDWNLNGILLIAFSLLFLAALLIGYSKKISAWLALLFGISFVVCCYTGLMLNMVF